MTELVFSGANRRRDLQKLKRIFDSVAGIAQGTKPGDNLKSPSAQVVLIHAERGLGKTRLAMELYRYLVNFSDPQDYWPKDVTALLRANASMPKSEMSDFEASPFFLWWGLQIPDGGNPGNTVFSGLENLLPHLAAARLAARRSGRSKDLQKEVGDFAAEIGLQVSNTAVEIAGEAVGLGILKRLAFATFKIGKILSQEFRDTALDSLVSSSLDSVVDSVLTDFSTLFNPKSKHFAKIPLVILIDDAQFSDGDTAMPAFLEKLIYRANAEYWPLMLIMTHWSRNLLSWEDENGVKHPPSSVNRVLDHARFSTDRTKGQYAECKGGTLSSDRFHEVDLGEPVDDLFPCFKSIFPGVKDESARLIVSRAGGNPRKLEQLALEILDNPIWFERTDMKKDFTKSGLDEALHISRLEIDKIVLNRLKQTPAPIRSCLALASIFGPRFVVELVDSVSREKFSATAREPLNVSERKYRFLQNVVDTSVDDVGSFREQLFHDAATEYRKSGLAKYNLAGWENEDEVLTVLSNLLDDLTYNIHNYDHLSVNDQILALQLSARLSLEAGTVRAGQALARTVILERNRGNPEGAYSAAEQFMQGFRC